MSGAAPGAPGALAGALVDWQRRAGRHDLPWQRTRDAYRIWVSEIMLQQTQVSTVLGYYERFLADFPDVRALAAAPIDAVLRHWSGLGYYSRARNLHAAARAVVERHGGVFPTDPQALEALPGVGRSTAAAIAAFSSGTRVPILDGNVKRVLCRVFAVEGFPGERAVEQRLWAIAERELPEPGEGRVETYTQALMDLGATVCVRSKPRCDACPVAARCEARLQGRIDALPAPRPAKATGTRVAHWLMVRAGGAVLLERRPASGLWGGLWSLPELVAPVPVDAGGRRVRAARAARPAQAAQAAQAARVEQAARAAGGAVAADTADAAAAAGTADATAARAWIAAAGLPVPADDPVPVAEVRHVFTHFRLRARVWAATLAGGTPPAAPEGHLWLPLDEAADAPLPRPVKTLLTGPVGQGGDLA